MADACLVDADCGGGAVCVCAKDAGFGLTIRLNRCVPSSCRIDADCGQGGVCSPTFGACQRPAGYHCRSASDSCCEDNDCGDLHTCGYAPETGRFQCLPPAACGG